MSQIKQISSLLVKDRGYVHGFLTKFDVSETFAKRILSSTKTSPLGIIAKSKRITAYETEWPDKVRMFCITKPISRETPGESVSVSYGKWEEKYIRHFFLLMFPEFPYKLTTFPTFIPKNLVAPTLHYVKRNTCPIHENIQISIEALNRFFKKKKEKDLIAPSSALDICLEFIM